VTAIVASAALIAIGAPKDHRELVLAELGH